MNFIMYIVVFVIVLILLFIFLCKNENTYNNRYKITFVAYDFPINRSVFVIYGLNEDATLDYDKVQYWKEIEE